MKIFPILLSMHAGQLSEEEHPQQSPYGLHLRAVVFLSITQNLTATSISNLLGGNPDRKTVGRILSVPSSLCKDGEAAGIETDSLNQRCAKAIKKGNENP